MKSAFMLKGLLGFTALFSAASVASAIVVPRIPSVAAASLISEGNKYLNELNYEQAIAKFEMALEIEPKDAEAIQGIIEAAYNAGDKEKAAEYAQYYWETARTDEQFLAENSEALVQVARGIGQLYEEPSEYGAFVEQLLEQGGGEAYQELTAEAAGDALSTLTAAGEYDAARELARKLYEATQKPEDRDALVKLYEICAEQAWIDHDYERALALLEEALQYAGNTPELQDELLKVAEDYITVCKNNQQYDKAREIIEKVQGLRGDQSLSDYVEEVAQMQEVDNSLQALIEQLNTAFDADDITTIETIMNGEDFKNRTSEVRRVLYSNSLRQSEKPQGRGTAIYIVGGWPYVYYGDYSDGRRQGSARWYYSSGKGYLTKYTLTWENDLPNGEGRKDTYGTIRHFDIDGNQTGESQTKEDVTFFCINGIMDGNYLENASVISDDPYDYELTIPLVNGHSTPLNEGEYPPEIDMYTRGGKIVAYDTVLHYIDDEWNDWWGDGIEWDPERNSYFYTSLVWQTYSPGLWTVSGLGDYVTDVTSGMQELILQ